MYFDIAITDLLELLPDLGAWGLWGLFIGTFLSATAVPFSADVLYITMLQMTSNPWACLAVAVAGNWLGNLTTFGIWLAERSVSLCGPF